MKNVVSASIFFVIFSLSISSLGQDCFSLLAEAERAYYKGQFNDIEGYLASCLENGFSHEQTVSAYRLLSLSYLFSRRFDKADSAMLLLLRTNPQYEFRPEDPPEFRKALKLFNVHPKFGIGFFGGLYQPLLKVEEAFNVRNVPTDVSYTGNSGFQAGVELSYFPTKRIIVEGSFEWQSISFTGSKTNDLVESRLEESQNRTQFSFAAGYYRKEKNFSLQLLGGFSVNTLQSATSDLYRKEKVTDRPGETIIVEEVGFSNMDHRTKIDYRPFLLLRIGVYARRKFVTHLFVRYEHGTQNMTTDRESDPAQAIRFEWLNDDFKTNYFTFGLSITKLFYRVKAK